MVVHIINKGGKMEIKFMHKAIKEALNAMEQDEVPIGAIIVLNGKIIAKGFNQTEKTQIATKHAEIIAIEKACKRLKSWRLLDCEMYVTLEPCAMCAGAIVNSRIKKVYFGAYETKSGCAVSKYSILSNSGLNHVTEFVGGIEEETCKKMLREYFSKKRKTAKN